MTVTIDFPVGDTAAAPGPVSWLQQADFLDLFDRILPFEYLEPMRVGLGDGYELFEGFAKVGERLSLAVARLDADTHFLTARGGVRATGTVQFKRDSWAAGAGTVLKGTVVRADALDRDFATIADAVFGATDLTVTVGIEAVACGYGWNLPGPGTTARGEALAGSIDTIKTPLYDPPFFDGSLYCVQVGDTVDGRPASLDQLGQDRGIVRRSGESDSAHLARCRSLPDTISPDAIDRALTNLLLPQGIAWHVYETWDAPFAIGYNGPTLADSLVYNDPRTDPLVSRWLDTEIQAATFIVRMPRLDVFSEAGFAYNVVGTAVADYTSTHGFCAMPAFNMPGDGSVPVALQGCYNGADAGRQAVYASVDDICQSLKAAGVTALLELEGN